MRKFSLISLILIIAIVLFFNKQVHSQFIELAESVPAETRLEESKLPRTADVWLDMISKAESVIDIETFYFAHAEGEALGKILDALKNAADRGVKIRIIIDRSFYEANEQGTDYISGYKNVQVRKIPFRDIAGGVMHAKYFVVDGKDLFVGSQNMDWRALEHIHETGIRIKDRKMADMFLAVFETDWKLCGDFNEEILKKLLEETPDNIITAKNPLKIKDEKYGKVILYPAFSPYEYVPKGFEYEEKALLKIIRNAKKRLHIRIYSYSPKERGSNEDYTEIDDALRDAAKRGVEIKIIFSDWAIKKSATDYIKDLSLVKGIKIRFSTIPQYSGGFIKYARVDHSKTFIADRDLSWISTSNWEKSYFYNSRNASVVIKNRKINSELEENFMLMWNSGYAEDVDVNRDYQPVKRY